MGIPSKEILQNEYLSILSNSSCLMNKVLVGCELSLKYKIEIRRFMWNIGGVKRNVYENILPLLKEQNVQFYIDIKD